jgi:RHS repeat-associated protein
VVDHAAPNDPVKSFTRRYAYDGQEILFEYDGSNNLLARYTHSMLTTDDVLAVNVTPSGVNAGLAQGSGTYQYLKDGQGTITDVTTNSGGKIQHYIYSAFGILLGIQDANAADITSSPILNTSYGFTGRERDSESGYMYYRARYYDPNTGRFLQKDPEPGKLVRPNSINNSYSYALNSPLLLADPDGRIAFLLGLGIAAVISGIVSGLINVAVNNGDWSKFGAGFVSGATWTVAVGLAGFGGGALAAALGWSSTAAFFTGAGFGALTGGTVSALFAPKGSRGLAFGIGAFAGFIGGGLSGLSGFNWANGLKAVPPPNPVPEGPPIPESQLSNAPLQTATQVSCVRDPKTGLCITP